MKRIKIAVIGLGYWGPNLIRNFLKIPDVDIEICCDISEKNIEKFNLSFPFLKTTKNIEDVLKNPLIEFIAIATPLSTHFLLAKQALLANKHVMVEKPMTSSSNQAKEIIALAKQKNRLLMVGHTFVYTEAVKTIKEIIAKKKLGKLYYYDSTRINLGLFKSDMNVIWDLAPHDLSILQFIFPGKPLSVRAFGSSFIHKRHAEVANIFIQYEKNITAHIHLSWLSPVKIRNILIAGSKRMIVYNDIEPSEKIRIYDKGIKISPSKITPFSPAYRSGNVTIPHLEQNEALYNELQHFVNCIKEKKQPITNGYSGLEVIKLLEYIELALQTKKEVFIK